MELLWVGWVESINPVVVRVYDCATGQRTRVVLNRADLANPVLGMYVECVRGPSGNQLVQDVPDAHKALLCKRKP